MNDNSIGPRPHLLAGTVYFNKSSIFCHKYVSKCNLIWNIDKKEVISQKY